MKATDRVVYVIDDDSRVREDLSELLASRGIEHVTLGSAEEYLSSVLPDVSACLVLDVHLPRISGLELQQRLDNEARPPIIFISGRGDVRLTVRAMKAGAIEFLTKPVDPALLLQAIDAAFSEGIERRRKHAELNSLRQRFSLLSPREREVFPLVVSGLLNKQAAAVLGITEVTLQVHRGQIMRKMDAASFADLVRMADRLGIQAPIRDCRER